MIYEALRQPPRVFVTGGTGYLGRRVVHALLLQGARVTVLVHRTSTYQSALGRLLPHVHITEGDVWNLGSLLGKARGHVCVIHLMGGRGTDPARGLTHRHMNYTATHTITSMAANDGVQRFVYVSCVGLPPWLSEFSDSQYMAEMHLRAWGKSWLVVRAPKLVGGERRHNMLSFMMKPLRFVPLLNRLAAVPVGMAGWAIARLALDHTAYGRIYYGPDLRRLGKPTQPNRPAPPPQALPPGAPRGG